MNIKWSILSFSSTTQIREKQRNILMSHHNSFKRSNNNIHNIIQSTNSRRSLLSTERTMRMSGKGKGNFNRSTSLPWVQSLASATTPRTGNATKKQTSIFSWNILAQHLFDSTQHWYTHVSPDDPVHTWYDRWPSIKDEIQLSEGDIICLQEVEFTAFEEDILPSMQDLGYDGVMQDSKSRKKGHGYGVATFWKQNRFQLQNVSHHSRTMLATLEDNNFDECKGFHINEETKEVIAILNCHLEGNPRKPVTRVRQLQKSLHELKNKFTHHHLVICGDFNCQLGQSACSVYMHYGSCPKHIPVIEFGRELKKNQIDELDREIEQHEYNFCSAYPIDLMTDNPFEYITFANAPGKFTTGLDQIWYHSDPHSSTISDTIVGLKHPFHSEDHRSQVVQYGLPSRFNPSDHMPIGCVLEWEIPTHDTLKDLRQKTHLEESTSSKEDVDVEKTEEDLIVEIAQLLEACPFVTNEQRSDFEFTISPVEGLPSESRTKPTENQIRQIQLRREVKRRIWREVSDDVRKVLERIIVLTKELTKLKK